MLLLCSNPAMDAPGLSSPILVFANSPRQTEGRMEKGIMKTILLDIGTRFKSPLFNSPELRTSRNLFQVCYGALGCLGPESRSRGPRACLSHRSFSKRAVMIGTGHYNETFLPPFSSPSSRKIPRQVTEVEIFK